MVRLDLLAEEIRNSGLKRGFVASAIGVTPQALAYKMSGARPFKVSEVQALAEVLRLTPGSRDEIFFAVEGD